MASKNNLLLSVSTLAFACASFFAATEAKASCLTVSADTTISNAANTCVTWTGGNLSLTTSGTVSGATLGITNNGSTVGNLTNAGSIDGTNAAVANLGVLVTLTNTGTITGSDIGIGDSGSIGTIVNGAGGMISGPFDGIGLGGTGIIGLITNVAGGTINGNAFGIGNSGAISIINNAGVISNSGTVSGDGIGNVQNASTIINATTGTITGYETAIANNGGSIGTISNSGALIGLNSVGIYNAGTLISIDNAVTGTITGNFAGIGNTDALTTITNEGKISAITYGVGNTGTIGGITNSGMIIGTGSLSSGIENQGHIGILSNNAGATIIGVSQGIYNNAGSIGAITNNGFISGTSAGIANHLGTINTITNSGIIAGSSISVYSEGINNGGSIGTIINAASGTISSQTGGIFDNGSIGTVINHGVITSTTDGIWIYAGGTIGLISNSGTITGGPRSVSYGIGNYGYVGSIYNGGGATISGVSVGILNSAGSIGAITNNGFISGQSAAINNSGTIDTITNSGTIISAEFSGINNSSIIGTIINTAGGTISGHSAAFNTGGSIGTIINQGVITSANAGIFIYEGGSTIGTIANLGTISSTYSGTRVACPSCAAIALGGNLGVLTNSGLIEGQMAITMATAQTLFGTVLSAVSNSGTIEGGINLMQNLTITGGSIGGLGTLTGYNGSIATITTNDHDLVFDSAAFQLLDDDINVGSANTVINNGLIRVNSTHSITGNYTQGAGSTLVVGVTDASDYGQLVISGAANLSGSAVSIAANPGGTLKAGESLTIVQAAGAANYSNVNVAAFDFTTSTSSISSGGYNDLIVSLAQGHVYQSIGSTAGGNGSAIGNALDQAIANGSTSVTPILTALNAIGQQQGTVAQGAALKQLAPNQLGPQLASSTVLINQGAGVIAQHQQTLLASNTDGPVGRAAGSEYRSGIFWGQVSGGIANGNQGAAVGGYGQNSYGLTAGTDFKVGKQASLGIALAYLHANAWGTGISSGSNLLTNSVQLTGYGSKRFGLAFVDGMLGLGYNHFDQSRAIDFLGTAATAGYSGLQYMARTEAGWDIPLPNKVIFTPVAGFDATRMDNDAYSESGAGAADLSVKRQIIDSYATTLGFRTSTVMATIWGPFQPEFKLGWIHDLNNNTVSTNGALDGVSFTTASPRIAPDGVQTGVAVSLQRTDSLTLSAAYNLEARQGFLSNDGLLKASLKF